MPTTINASASSGLITTADTSTILQLQTGGTTAVTVDASQQVGIGVTPSAWSGVKALQVGSGACLVDFGSSNAIFGSNFYNDGVNKYINTDFASFYQQNNGIHAWASAASGTAGSTVSFNQAMTLSVDGNLGIGTTSPTVPFHISRDSETQAIINRATTTTGASFVRFTNGGGNYYLGPDSSTGTRAFSSGGAAYGFSISVEGVYPIVFGNTNIERMRIDSSGNLLVGTSTFVGAGGMTFSPSAAGPRAHYAGSATTNANTTHEVYSTVAGAYRFYVGYGGTVFATSTTISAASDQRLKENVQDLDVGLDAVMALKPRKFDWKEGKGKDIKGDRGWIAQEFEQVFPDLIDEWRDPAPEGEEPYKSVRADLIPVLVKAIQEQQAIITSLTDRITALEGTTP